MNELIRELRLHQADFFFGRQRGRGDASAIGATLHAHGGRWYFEDVHNGSAAHSAGIQPGDCLLAVAGIEAIPPTIPSFAVRKPAALDIEGYDGSRERVYVDSIFESCTFPA